MAQSTEDVLGVIWEGDDVPGILFYGLWRSPVPAAQLPSTTRPLEAIELSGPGWHVQGWRVRFLTFPPANQWIAEIYGLLSEQVTAGAIMAWCALEGEFADPPRLFDREVMGDGVYAALSPDLGFVCSAIVGHAYQSLPSAIYDLVGDVARGALRDLQSSDTAVERPTR